MSSATHRLTFPQINDLHGYVELHPELVRHGGEWRFTRLGGLARIARSPNRAGERRLS